MKGLFSRHSDECTYSYNQLLFVLKEEQLDSIEFKDKLKSMFPDIKDWEIDKLIYGDEEIIVYDDNSWESKISIQDVESL